MTQTTHDPRTIPQKPVLRFRGLRTISALIIREMTTTYGRSPGGYAWAILEPVAMILMLAVGFSLLFRSPPLGTSFLLFYTSAILPLRTFQGIQSKISTAISFNRPLMSYPRVSFADAILSRFILAFLTQCLVNIVIIAGLFTIENIREIIDVRLILIAYSGSIILGLGVGVLNCFLILSYPIWNTIWNILSRPLLLISAVFYIYEDLPEVPQEIFWFNPLIHITSLSRDGYYYSYHPEHISMAYVYIFGAIPMFFGFLLLKRHSRELLQK